MVPHLLGMSRRREGPDAFVWPLTLGCGLSHAWSVRRVVAVDCARAEALRGGGWETSEEAGARNERPSSHHRALPQDKTVCQCMIVMSNPTRCRGRGCRRTRSPSSARWSSILSLGNSHARGRHGVVGTRLGIVDEPHALQCARMACGAATNTGLTAFSPYAVRSFGTRYCMHQRRCPSYLVTVP